MHQAQIPVVSNHIWPRRNIQFQFLEWFKAQYVALNLCLVNLWLNIFCECRKWLNSATRLTMLFAFTQCCQLILHSVEQAYREDHASTCANTRVLSGPLEATKSTSLMNEIILNCQGDADISSPQRMTTTNVQSYNSLGTSDLQPVFSLNNCHTTLVGHTIKIWALGNPLTFTML